MTTNMKKRDWKTERDSNRLKQTQSNNGFGSMTFLASSSKLISWNQERNMIFLVKKSVWKKCISSMIKWQGRQGNHRQIKRLNSYSVSYTTASLMSSSRVSLRFMSFFFFLLHSIQSIHRKKEKLIMLCIRVDQIMYFVVGFTSCWGFPVLWCSFLSHFFSKKKGIEGPKKKGKRGWNSLFDRKGQTENLDDEGIGCVLDVFSPLTPFLSMTEDRGRQNIMKFRHKKRGGGENQDVGVEYTIQEGSNFSSSFH